MILSELHLENYKQYIGPHHIAFPEQGVVAIIGQNGAGKTTLFEAIEWCLYNPRQIPSDEVAPRGGVGDTRVKLILEDPRDGTRYVIERIRRRRGVDAEIYREDQSDAPIVKGTRDVTEYVKHRLIGLGHRAFVSTFFTRQKELTFFGDLKETERRREVAQLLGFETIRAAQIIIGDDRMTARNDYQLLARQYDEEVRDRDFAAELVIAESAIAAANIAKRTAAAQLQRAEATRATARATLDHWTALEREDAAYAQESERLEGDLRAAASDQRHAVENLARLDRLAVDRERLLPLRQAEPASQQAVLAHEAERDRFQLLQAHTESLRRAVAAADDIICQAQKLVRTTDTRGLTVPGWSWDGKAEADPGVALSNLIHVIDGLNPRAETAHAEQVQALVRVIDLRQQARLKAKKFQDRLDTLRQTLKDLRAGGDPRQRLEAAGLERDEARQAAQVAAANGKQYASRRSEIERTVAAIAAAAQLPECPTCHRPLSLADAEIAMTPLRAQIAEFKELEREAASARRAAQARLAAAELELEQGQKRREEWQKLEASIESGSDYVRAAVEDHRRLADECSGHLTSLNRQEEPTPGETQAAVDRAEITHLVASRRGLVAHLHDQLTRSTHDHESARHEITALGNVRYDPEAHQQATIEYREIREAIARIEQIERDLAHRAEYEQQHAAAATAAAAVTAQLDRCQTQRALLKFDAATLEAATVADRGAADQARDADRVLAGATHAAHSAIRDRDECLEQHRRIEDLARRSERRRREHDELDRMYREFVRFEQHVAQLVTPQLADYAGELLAEVTDHKYDHVVFDDNYGLRIFSGPEHFPIDQFSGGERDVAALCARLALSRFIGSQAIHPPRFLVLDEVFGSLDADRRSHVLNALLQLAGTDGPFRQLFVISHVDDIRTSPALDEVWRVREQDGASTVENVSRGLIIDEV